MPLFVPLEAMLQRAVHDHSGRGHRPSSAPGCVPAADPPRSKSGYLAVSSSNTCAATAEDRKARDAWRVTDGSGRRLASLHLIVRDDALCGHQRQRLVPAAEDGSRVVRGRCVVARRLGDAGQQRRLVGIVGGEGREGPAEVVLAPLWRIRTGRCPCTQSLHNGRASLPSRAASTRTAPASALQSTARAGSPRASGSPC